MAHTFCPRCSGVGSDAADRMSAARAALLRVQAADLRQREALMRACRFLASADALALRASRIEAALLAAGFDA